ncbi:MAG: phage tail tube protein [Pseudonocardiaceae bacterium]
MTTPAGLGGQFGYASETTPGTLVTVDTFLPINSESLKTEIEQLESQGIRAGRLVTAAWKQGQRTISGTVEMELWNTDIAPLFRHMFGAVATATNGAQWDYTFTPADLRGEALTIQVGKPDISGTVRPFTYGGAKVSEWTLGAEAGAIAMLSLEIVAMTETNGVALATASYDSGLAPFVFTEGNLSIAGSTNNTVQSFEVAGNNGITERFRLGAATSREYLQNGFREYTGSATTDFENLTQYNRFLDGDEAALVLTFDNGTETLVITLNVRFDGETPELAGPELLEQTVAFKAVHATSDADAITAVLTNGEGLTGAD